MPTEIQSHQTLMKDRSPSPNMMKNPYRVAEDVIVLPCRRVALQGGEWRVDVMPL